MKTRPLMLLSALILAAPAAADTLWYSTTFENGVGPEWSTSTNTSAPGFSRFLGRFSDATAVTLTVPAVPPPATTGSGGGSGGGGGGSGSSGAGNSGMPYLLVFDFYCIDSWDGFANFGPDRFVVRINDVKYFEHTFSNQHEYYSYPTAPTEGPDFLGFTAGFKDSIYRNITIAFDPGQVTDLSLRFYGETMQGMQDESWGIDNVRIYHAPVPSPGSIALLTMSGLVLARRRR